ncbi:hypothetical protein Afil01_68560 [Actinorhabdospora filicis]|uniref:Excreted virulence factor EspC, type VII ESX diderm n=1 Tax=Actinorhabdospora filicis TaxID=1785913 RepID=A0A9W6SSG6_9ACTN|nr:type VII secretion target [Actinorhabdospora filicis]GLZ82049.1 hypothetical protein Afil01_68560 [Actinorhabdospora filicis]
MNFQVDPEELRGHARNLESIAEGFQAVKDASAHIAQDDEAYGQLCGWISAILEGRHGKQDDLVASVEANLRACARALVRNADRYRDTEDGHAKGFDRMISGPGG